MTKLERPLPYRRAGVVLGLAVICAIVIYLVARGAVLFGLALALGGVAFGFFASKASRNIENFEDEDGGPYANIKSDFLDVRVDLTSSIMKGAVLKGLFSGEQVGDLHAAELALVWQDCRSDDPRSAELIRAHLDAIAPHWREDVARGEEQFTSGPDGRMSAAEALKILGLNSSASRDQIRHAHRDLMLKLHPDRGGSTYLSSKINEAKDVLLSRASE